MSNKLYIFDTTLRDGEQVPGASLNTIEKVEIAKQLEKLGVDIIEAGFPISSPGDFESVQRVSEVIKDSTVCALARAIPKDIDTAAEAIKNAKKARIHTFISTSDIHIKHQFKTTKKDILNRAVKAVKYAKKFQEDVEFSAMDAGRSNLKYLAQVIEAAIKAGATTVNIPDTTGYMFPQEYGKMIKYLFRHVKGIDKVIVSTHNHNDLGLATATTLAGVEAGARQVEVTINGIGERAGNAALEEVVMALRTRKDKDVKSNVKTTEIMKTSHLVSSIMKLPVQANKAIVGRNAFAHSSGIHQDGIIKHRETYEIINPEDIGLEQSDIILTARSGRNALSSRLKHLGYDVKKDGISKIYDKFLKVADSKKEVTDHDLQMIMTGEANGTSGVMRYKMDLIQVICGNKNVPTATIRIKDNDDGMILEATAAGTGPIDASYKAIDKIIRKKLRLKEFLVQAVTEGIDATGKVNVEIDYKGRNYYGEGEGGDIVVASAKAYLDAINKITK
jgi:2-isopropylmalate synthase